MNFLLVYRNLSLGGIETLIVRMARWLVENGHSVRVVLSAPDVLDELLPPEVGVCYLERPVEQYSRINRVREELSGRLGDAPDVVYSFCYRTALLAEFIVAGSGWKERPRILTGVYHPHDVLLTGAGRKTWVYPFVRHLYQRVVGVRNTLFMNEYCRRSNGEDLGVDFTESGIFPLPVREYAPAVKRVSGSTLRIVSVGRMTSFKTYNILMPALVRRLRDQGNDVEWTVYGEGELAAQSRSAAVRHGVEKYCKYMGNCNYEALPDVFANADVFVGMGTAAIEAALAGLPTLVIPAYSREPVCFGWWNEIDGFWCGEDGHEREGNSCVDVLGKLEELLAMQPDEYDSLSRKGRAKSVKLFGLDANMRRFVDVCEGASQRVKLAPWWFSYAYSGGSRLSKMKKRLRSFVQGNLA